MTICRQGMCAVCALSEDTLPFFAQQVSTPEPNYLLTSTHWRSANLNLPHLHLNCPPSANKRTDIPSSSYTPFLGDAQQSFV
ncbi:hypothetical protein BC936DRAFT_142325 [Jimgerdemannia flammicorona]|uniref:Uncharacterized protein n=1 Tax=Jimgerdemannia flammicorona TaxID=994334 RepID=A0A433DFG2_9FUNG|nr:hypothetical protein BC936DRAFT_142325 [Jimgerdemannia flammicorona]